MYSRASEDPEALRSILADDVEWRAGATGELVGQAGVTYGPEGVLEFFRRWVGAFDDWGFSYGEIAEVGDDGVVARIHQWGTGKTSGIRTDNSFWQAWKLRDGKAIVGANHDTREEALAAMRDAPGSTDI